MKILYFLCALSLYSAPAQIELFMDWHSDAKGQELFALETQTLPSKIRKKLLEHQWDIQSWEREKYIPYIMSWQEVHSWNDFLWWLGLNLPCQKEEIPRYFVFWSLGPKVSGFDFTKMPKDRMVLFIWEPPVVQPESHDPKFHACFHKIFTWDDDLVDGITYFKFHYPVLQKRIDSIIPFSEKKFCTLINGRLCSKHPKQLYGERESMIRFFEDKPQEFDLYGRFWEKRNYKNYRGAIDNKIEVLKNYKFCICYENTRDVKGYVTEKIFDCFAAGVVPIYWGASNICEYVPEESFIDRRKFKDNQEVYDFLKNIKEEEYAKYLQSAQDFLQSEKAQLFSEEHFVDTFLQMILSSTCGLFRKS